MKKLIAIVFVLLISFCSFTVLGDDDVSKAAGIPPDTTQPSSGAPKTVSDNVGQNTLDVNQAVAKQAGFVYSYIPNQVYKVYCAEDRIVDVQLQPGEEIIYIGGADTVRWIIDKDVSGSGPTKQYHIFIKPLKALISTNLIITTDRHIYHLDVYAKDFTTPIINWEYPIEEKLAFMRQQLKEQVADAQAIPLGTDSMTLENLNFKYKIDGRNYPWKPLLVFDDSLKTYIQMPAAMKSSECPALFLKNGRTLALVNYRVKNGYFIVDRLGENFEMHVGKDVVKIRKQG